MAEPTSSSPENSGPKPRISIKYCTQCKWMLRSAYELLSTFSTDLGEVALVPGTGGVFTVTISSPSSRFSSPGVQASGQDGAADAGKVIWDRKRDGGFPETKVLKSLVRNEIDPARDLGHTDRALRGGGGGGGQATTTESKDKESKECQDCQ